MSTATTADTLDVRNPADNRHVATVPVDDRENVNGIAADLRRAQVGAEAGPRQRARWLHRWRDWILDASPTCCKPKRARCALTPRWRRQRRVSSLPTTPTHAEEFLTGEQVRSSGLLRLSKRLSTTYHPYPVVAHHAVELRSPCSSWTQRPGWLPEARSW
jgi:acyl-CoA reductase-like NAD-dependent aldehyde dehydrogenase